MTVPLNPPVECPHRGKCTPRPAGPGSWAVETDTWHAYCRVCGEALAAKLNAWLHRRPGLNPKIREVGDD